MTTSPSSLTESLNELLSEFPSNAEVVIQEAPKLREQFEALKDQDGVEKCLVLEVYSYHHLWRKPEALKLLEEWEPVAQRLGWDYTKIKFLNLRGIMARRSGNLGKAGALYRKGIEASTKPNEKAMFTHNLGLVFLDLGEFAETLDLFKRSLQLWREVGDLKQTVPVLLNLAKACQAMGKQELSLRHLDEALALTKQFGDYGTITSIWLTIADCHGDLCDYDKQREALKQAKVAASEAPETRAGVTIDMQAVALEWGKFQLVHGDVDEGRRLIEEFLEAPPEGLKFVGSAAAILLAEHESTSAEAAEHWLRVALEIDDKRNDRSEKAKAHLALSRLIKNKDSEAAYHHLEAARTLEREQFSESSKKSLEAVALQRETWDLNQKIQQEQRIRKETARLLDEVGKQKERAEKADRAKTAILGIVAHDLRNELGSLLLGVETLQSEFDRHSILQPWQEDVNGLVKGAADLRALLLRLLDYSAVEQGTISSRPEDLDLLVLTKECIADWRLVASQKQQILNLILPEGSSFKVNSDPARVAQVLNNLISNALKYSQPGAEVDIKLRFEEGCACLDVCDRGPGFTVEDQAKLFGPFQTLSNLPTGDETSTGLGLHLSQAIAKNEGGQLDFIPREGGGSIFRLSLPIS